MSIEDLILTLGQVSSSDQQRSVKLSKSEIRLRVNAVEIKYKTENDLNLIPCKQDSTEGKKSVAMFHLLRPVQKELSNLRTDVHILKKVKNEI